MGCDWGISENLQERSTQKHLKKLNEIYFLPKRLRKPVIVFFEFLTSCCRAWFPIYFLSFIDQHRYTIEGILKFSITISSPWNATAQAIWRSPSSLAIHSANPSYKSSELSIPEVQKNSTLYLCKNSDRSI